MSADVLRQIVVDAGGREPRSQLATGNLTFSAPAGPVEAIGKAIEDSIESVLGRREDVFIRTLAWLTAAVLAIASLQGEPPIPALRRETDPGRHSMAA